MINFANFYDIISFAHFIHLLESASYKYKTNTLTFPRDDIPFEIIVQFWKE